MGPELRKEIDYSTIGPLSVSDACTSIPNSLVLICLKVADKCVGLVWISVWPKCKKKTSFFCSCTRSRHSNRVTLKFRPGRQTCRLESCQFMFKELGKMLFICESSVPSSGHTNFVDFYVWFLGCARWAVCWTEAVFSLVGVSVTTLDDAALSVASRISP
jgi:hypothetical protein